MQNYLKHKVLFLEVAELQINPPTGNIFCPQFITNWSYQKQVEIGKVSTRERIELYWVKSSYGF